MCHRLHARRSVGGVLRDEVLRRKEAATLGDPRFRRSACDRWVLCRLPHRGHAAGMSIAARSGLGGLIGTRGNRKGGICRFRRLYAPGNRAIRNSLTTIRSSLRTILSSLRTVLSSLRTVLSSLRTVLSSLRPADAGVVRQLSGLIRGKAGLGRETICRCVFLSNADALGCHARADFVDLLDAPRFPVSQPAIPRVAFGVSHS
jgi:hypothetical protein